MAWFLVRFSVVGDRSAASAILDPFCYRNQCSWNEIESSIDVDHLQKGKSHKCGLYTSRAPGVVFIFLLLLGLENFEWSKGTFSFRWNS